MEGSDSNNKKLPSCLKEATMTISPPVKEDPDAPKKNNQIINPNSQSIAIDNSINNVLTSSSSVVANSSSNPSSITNDFTQEEQHNKLFQSHKFLKASSQLQPWMQERSTEVRDQIVHSNPATSSDSRHRINNNSFSSPSTNNVPNTMPTTTYSIYNLPTPSTSFNAGPSGLATKQQPQAQLQQQLNQQHHSKQQPQSQQQQEQATQSMEIDSTSQNHGMNPLLSNEIESLFECPICYDYATPPIYQCQNGHLVCNSCSSKINECATCRVPITNPSIRNLQLDRLANSFQIPCKYNFNGCDWKSYWFQKRDHEDSCKFISLTCPCPGTTCKWSGLLSEVMNHLGEQHKSITTLSGEDIVFLATDINLKGAVDWVMIQSCFNHHFLLVLEKQEFKSGQQLFFAVVQLIGSKNDAEKFRYKLELGGNTSGHSRRLQWEARTNSVLDGIQSAISNHDCLVFDARMAEHFLTNIHQMDKDSCHQNRKVNNPHSDNYHQHNHHQDENLAINVTIERCQPNSLE